MKSYAICLIVLVAQVFTPQLLKAQQPVADQTFAVSGTHEFAYALAEGDQLTLNIQLIAGRRLKAVEVVEWPSNLLFRAYELDTTLTKTLPIPHTGVYVVRVSEQGLSKKICRFTLHRTPASAATARIDTRVGWDLNLISEWQVLRRPVAVGKRTDVVSLGGQVTVPGAKMGLRVPRTAYQFTLPPNTVQWAFRIGVAQSVADARRADADKFNALVRQGATKIMAYQPETALAAFALGMAVDLTTSTAGEDVEYALLDGPNCQKYLSGADQYDAYLWQGGISVDVQRRYAPLVGTYSLGFKNNNWVDDINVSVDIDAVTETPLFEEEIYLAPVKP
jgi:hypothetical protein